MEIGGEIKSDLTLIWLSNCIVNHARDRGPPHKVVKAYCLAAAYNQIICILKGDSYDRHTYS